MVLETIMLQDDVARSLHQADLSLDRLLLRLKYAKRKKDIAKLRKAKENLDGVAERYIGARLARILLWRSPFEIWCAKAREPAVESRPLVGSSKAVV